MQLFAELARISKYYGGSVSLSTNTWLMRCAKVTYFTEKCKKTTKKRPKNVQF